MASYFSIEKLLADEERTPFRFETDVLNMGHLEPGNPDPDIHKRSRVELPLWLARILQEQNFGDVELPPSFNSRTISSIKADPNGLDFSQQPFYFHVGVELATLDKNLDLLGALRNGFVTRMKGVLDQSQTLDHAHPDFINKLSAIEKQLFDASHSARVEYEKFKNRENEQIQAWEAQQKPSNKRKREDD